MVSPSLLGPLVHHVVVYYFACVTAGHFGPELFFNLCVTMTDRERERVCVGGERLMQNVAVGFPYDLTCNHIFLIFYCVCLSGTTE